MGGDASGDGSGQTGIDEARRRIAEAARTGATVLDIGGLGLTEVPEELYALGQLQVLYLGAAEGVREKPQFALTQEDKKKCNAVRALPPALFTSLPHLTHLHLDHNQLTGLPDQIAAALTGLTTLNLADNQIGADGARALAALAGLTTLNLADNQIGADGARALLDAWSDEKISQLDRLYLGDNSIGDIGVPAETLESGDAQAIFAVYRAFRQAKRQRRLKPLNEAKMLVVGNEAVGKTSLIRYLVHGQARDPDEKKTEGTAIQEKIEIQDWSPDAADIKLNVWDFGGQEIMHGTHRYFLTRRSLYLIVLEDRKEDDRSIYNWLRIIKNRGGDAPIIVVINKSDKGCNANIRRSSNSCAHRAIRASWQRTRSRDCERQSLGASPSMMPSSKYAMPCLKAGSG